MLGLKRSFAHRIAAACHERRAEQQAKVRSCAAPVTEVPQRDDDYSESDNVREEMGSVPQQQPQGIPPQNIAEDLVNDPGQERQHASCMVVTLSRYDFETWYRILPTKFVGVFAWLPWGLQLEEATMQLKATKEGSIAWESEQVRACVGKTLTQVNCTPVRAVSKVSVHLKL